MAGVGHVLAREPVHGKRVSPCAPQWQRPPSPLLRAWEGPFPRSSRNVCLPPWRPQGGGGSQKRPSRRARNCLASADLLPEAAGGKPELHAASPSHPEAPSPGISPQAPAPPLPRPRVTNGMESCSDVPRAVPGTVQPHTSSPSRRPKMPGPQQALCLAGPGLASADQCPRRVPSEMLGAAEGGRDRVLQSWRSAGLRHPNISHSQVPCVWLRLQRLPGPRLRRRAGTRAGAGDRLLAANGMPKAVG